MITNVGTIKRMLNIKSEIAAQLEDKNERRIRLEMLKMFKGILENYEKTSIESDVVYVVYDEATETYLGKNDIYIPEAKAINAKKFDSKEVAQITADALNGLFNNNRDYIVVKVICTIDKEEVREDDK